MAPRRVCGSSMTTESCSASPQTRRPILCASSTTALQGTGLNLSLFDRDVRFWSFENGFSKPDPHVFPILTARLETRGITPAETLMVGDRLDNDIEPARARGWQTWQLVSVQRTEQSGNWRDLHAWLKSNR